MAISGDTAARPASASNATPKAPHPLISAALAMPLTHRVITLYSDGDVHTLDTRSLASAQTFATGERRKIGRDLIDRETGATVRVVSVEIGGVETAALSLPLAG